MIKIKPAALNVPYKPKTGKKVVKNLAEKIKEVPKTKLDFSGEEEGYFKAGGRIINIVFPR